MTEVERLTSGYQLAEAPVATPAGGVVFSDVLGGGVREWDPATGEVEVVIPKRRGVGGMARHRDGGLVVSGRDVSLVADGESRPLYVPDEGSGITGINDLTVDPDGHVVVGHLRFRPFAGESPVPGEFVTVDADGGTTGVVGDVLWTNGCAFVAGRRHVLRLRLPAWRRARRRPAGRRLYGPSRSRSRRRAARPTAWRSTSPARVWVALGARASVGRFTPDGRLDSEVDVPTGFVASLCFGGTDGRDLFITTARAATTPAPSSAPAHRSPARRSSSAPAERVDLRHLVGGQLPARGRRVRATCSGDVAPAMTEAMVGRQASHDIASSRIVWSRSVANAVSFSSTSKVRSLTILLHAALRHGREPGAPPGGGLPRVTLPVSIPLASGK